MRRLRVLKKDLEATVVVKPGELKRGYGGWCQTQISKNGKAVIVNYYEPSWYVTDDVSAPDNAKREAALSELLELSQGGKNCIIRAQAQRIIKECIK